MRDEIFGDRITPQTRRVLSTKGGTHRPDKQHAWAGEIHWRALAQLLDKQFSQLVSGFNSRASCFSTAANARADRVADDKDPELWQGGGRVGREEIPRNWSATADKRSWSADVAFVLTIEKPERFEKSRDGEPTWDLCPSSMNPETTHRN